MRLKLYAEWVKHMNAYRLYFPHRPSYTVVYVESLDQVTDPKNMGYEVVVVNG